MKKILSIIFSILLIFQMVVLATPWDVSTATYDSVSKAVGTQDNTPFDVAFKPDGTKMYILGYTNDTVYQYSLSTAWNVSTASYDSISKSIGSEEIYPFGVDFKPDGTKMYIMGYSSDTVYQYSLSTAWNVGTASYDSISKAVGSQDDSPRGVDFKSDGTKMYIMGDYNNTVYQYSLPGEKGNAIFFGINY
jgi:DNA-binding beta-propeller fold protein YncE